MSNQANRRRRAICSALALGAVHGAAVAQPGNVRVVSAGAPGGGNGQTWGTAFNDLQDALDAAAGSGGTINEIWVARGTYRPRVPVTADPREVTFALANNLGLYGGFAGFETQVEQRDPWANVTTLSGARSGALGVYHVVTATGVDQSGVLDGFTVAGGDQNLSASVCCGAGLMA